MSTRYQNSEGFLERSERVIPLGSQTFSKSRTQYPVGAAPLYLERGKDSRVWDIDGNEYIDFNGGLAALILGHADPDVNKAVAEQLEYGTTYPLPHKLETLVAEEIKKLVPCAEKVRFGKNGSDATAGAVRLARAYTKKDHVLVCGYHGWQDWYIGSTARNLGVPEATRALTHSFQYNDINSLVSLLQKYKDQVAAVILEPMNATFPKNDFLNKVAEVTREAKALLIFDETVTGFRYDLGGAQKYFDVTPDLATFGKAMANGFPLAALAGKAEYMSAMEDIFFSFTFGGETLSLAAGLATLKKLQEKNILSSIHEKGEILSSELRRVIAKNELSDCLEVSGHPSWVFLNMKDFGGYDTWTIKTYFLQEIFKRGIIMIGTHNMYYSHSHTDVEKLISVYDEVFSSLNSLIKSRSIEQNLSCKVLQPLFKIR